MDDRSNSETDSDSTLLMCEKRNSTELGDSAGHIRKRVKMRDLKSVVRDEEMLNHYPKTTSVKDGGKQFHFHTSQGDMSQVTKADEHLGVSVETTGRRDLFPSSADNALKPMDLNVEVSQVKSFGSGDSLRTCNRRKSAVLRTKEVEPVNSRISGSDNYSENLDDVSSSVNQDHSYFTRKPDVLKSRTTPNGPLEPRDPHMIWKEMKQNGFISSSQHGGIPIRKQHTIPIPKQHGGIPIPKQWGRKSNDDLMKKNMEIAKKKEVDRFAKMAAPSGLLSKLNPGIITNVRNMKQVRSIIQSLVRSERLDAESKQGSELKCGRKDISGTNMEKEKENMNPPTLQRSFSPKNESSLCPLASMEITGQQIRTNKPTSSCFEERREGATTCILNSDSAPGNDDFLALKLTSTAKASQSASHLPCEESVGSASSLSVKAATIASQWLELLHQDIKGRLGALRRSKKRLRGVLQTELPMIYAQEFTPIQEDDPSLLHTSGYSRKAIADMHHTRWDRLFDQMDKGLCEEEKKMEEWLNQVGEMLHHCEEGLQLNQLNEPSCFLLQGICGNKSRLEKMDKAEGELAVRAAAASIYSTCNYLSSVQRGAGL